MTIERMRVQPRPGSGHLISATADATHFNGCLGTIAITDSHFDGMGDDAINIKTGLYLKVLERVDDHTVLSMHNLGIESLPAAGDTMEFIRTATLIPYAEGKVASASIDPDKRHRVRFVDPLPPQMEIGDVLGNATTVPRVRIRGCTVQRNRARGFLLQTRDVLVEDCTFRNCTSGGIFVMTETVHFYEAIGTRDVTVRRCTFDNCSYTGPLGEGVLLVGGYAPNFALPPEPGVHRNIRLEDNVIRGAHNAGIFVAGADGIVIRGNVIENTGRRPTREECRSGIFIMSSRNVEVTNNRLSGLAEGVVPFRTGPNLDLTTLQVRQNSGIPSP